MCKPGFKEKFYNKFKTLKCEHGGRSADISSLDRKRPRPSSDGVRRGLSWPSQLTLREATETRVMRLAPFEASRLGLDIVHELSEAPGEELELRLPLLVGAGLVLVLSLGRGHRCFQYFLITPRGAKNRCQE